MHILYMQRRFCMEECDACVNNTFSMFRQWLDRKYSGEVIGVLEIEAAVDTVDTIILSEDNSDQITDTIQ